MLRWRPDRVATLTIAPELRPYSALNVELSTLNSDTVLIDGWNVTWLFDRSFRLMPLIMKLTEVSRLPAEKNENEPWPRSGALRPAFCGGVTPPGISGPRSTKCRPFSGISCTVRSAITWPTETVAVSISGDTPTTVRFSAIAPTVIRKLTATVCATPSSALPFWSWNPSMCATTL